MPDLPHRRRRQRPAWTEPIVQRLTPAIKALVIVDALLFFLLLALYGRPAGAALEAHLGLGPGFFRGELWQPLTALFVHFPHSFLSFVFNLIGLWFVGAFIERTLGTRRFLILFLGAGVLANLAIAGVAHLNLYGAGYVFDGCSFAVLALFVAFGRLFGRAPAQILPGLTLQARYLSLLLVLWAVVVDLLRGDWPALAGTLTCVLVGYLFVGGFSGFRAFLDGIRARRLRRRYRVIDGGGGRRRGPKYLN
jgi:membrane associated rhomboid family serine protease